MWWLPTKVLYGLELRYYDQNGLLINHQFSSYYYKTDKQGNQVPDEISSALQMHQHFFGIGHSTLDQNAVVAAGKAPIVEKGLQMAILAPSMLRRATSTATPSARREDNLCRPPNTARATSMRPRL